MRDPQWGRRHWLVRTIAMWSATSGIWETGTGAISRPTIVVITHK